MLTYMAIKNAIKDSYDLEDLIMHMTLIFLMPILDIVFIFFQPIFYISYKKWLKENEWRR